MKEGTISLLIGCHQFIMHPLCVLIAWHKEYRSWPKFWQLVCIFLHDVGHWGLDYLTDPEQKKRHWKLGAYYAYKLFGRKGFFFVAGHVTRSGFPRSKLYIPDKRSWLEAPNWWLKTNSIFEDFGNWYSENPAEWKNIVRENLDNGCPKGSHELYLERKHK